jgi:hypothetical protein
MPCGPLRCAIIESVRNQAFFAAMTGVFGAVMLFAAPAQARQSTALSIGARVAPKCSITVEPSTTRDDQSPAVRVQCGRSNLHVLRVTTDRGDDLRPLTTFAGSQLQAGGEVVFVVPVTLDTVASRLPVIAPPPPPDRRPIRVTLDF